VIQFTRGKYQRRNIMYNTPFITFIAVLSGTLLGALVVMLT